MKIVKTESGYEKKMFEEGDVFKPLFDKPREKDFGTFKTHSLQVEFKDGTKEYINLTGAQARDIEGRLDEWVTCKSYDTALKKNCIGFNRKQKVPLSLKAVQPLDDKITSEVLPAVKQFLEMGESEEDIIYSMTHSDEFEISDGQAKVLLSKAKAE